jgi:hypothetical protein
MHYTQLVIGIGFIGMAGIEMHLCPRASAWTDGVFINFFLKWNVVEHDTFQSLYGNERCLYVTYDSQEDVFGWNVSHMGMDNFDNASIITIVPMERIHSRGGKRGPILESYCPIYQNRRIFSQTLK